MVCGAPVFSHIRKRIYIVSKCIVGEHCTRIPTQLHCRQQYNNHTVILPKYSLQPLNPPTHPKKKEMDEMNKTSQRTQCHPTPMRSFPPPASTSLRTVTSAVRTPPSPTSSLRWFPLPASDVINRG